MKDYQFSANLQ